MQKLLSDLKFLVEIKPCKSKLRWWDCHTFVRFTPVGTLACDAHDVICWRAHARSLWISRALIRFNGVSLWCAYICTEWWAYVRTPVALHVWISRKCVCKRRTCVKSDRVWHSHLQKAFPFQYYTAITYLYTIYFTNITAKVCWRKNKFWPWKLGLKNKYSSISLGRGFNSRGICPVQRTSDVKGQSVAKGTQLHVHRNPFSR